MYPVAQDFNEKMKETVRHVYGKIQIDYTDPFLDQSINMQSSENANVSYPNQTADSIQEPIGKIFSLDGSCVLDGTYILAPGPEEAETHQMGWWGKQLAGVDGTFIEPYPALTATFFSRPIHSLKVIGDGARREYPVDFIIKLYDSQSTVLYTKAITGNTQVNWSKTIEPVTQVVKMELVITKWSHAGRQVKILEFFTSIQEVYEGDDILMINLLEEREVSQGSLPVGNISANEIDIRLYNRNRKFDAGNKQSPLYETLKANRRIKAWIGAENELVPLGTFGSGDWNVPEQGLYAHTTGRDRLELLRKSTYSTSEVLYNKVLSFDGIDDYVEINNPLIQGNDFTISFWTRLMAVKNQCFFCTRTVLGLGISIFALSGNKIRIDTGGGAQWSTGYELPINTNTNTHITVTKDSNAVSLYINGELCRSTNEVGGMDSMSTIATLGASQIDGGGFCNELDGIIDEFSIWNVTLAKEQIQDIMNKELTGNEFGLIGYWKLNEGTGTIAHDNTANNNHGTIYGATWTDGEPPTLYDLAQNILQDAELTEEEYYIDPELQQFPVPYAWFDSQSHREALRKIAEACLGQVYCDREGIIRVEGPSYLENQVETAIDITQDDYFNKNNPVKWSEIANYIEVETQPLRPDVAQEVYRSNEPINIAAGETKDITAYYNYTPCIDAVASIEGTGTIENVIYYAWGATVKVTSSTTGIFTLVINAKPLKILNKEKAIAKDDASIVDNGKLGYVFPKNPLVQTREIAQAIADKLLQYYKNPRRDVEINWRGNSALLLGDRVSVTDKNEVNNYNVVKQELEYDGGLRAKMSGRKVT